MHTQSMLEVPGRQPHQRLDINGTRAAEHTWFHRVIAFALTCTDSHLKIPKPQILRAVPLCRLNRIPDYPATAGLF
jgi:hypothetical protein